MAELRLVLHVDDDPAMLRIVRNSLSTHGYEVISCQDPTAAQAIILRENIRVCLLDIDMPGQSGLELLRQIKKLDSGIQVIMLTGLVSMSTVLESNTHGAEAIFFKPLADYQPLLEALDDSYRKIDRWWRALQELRQLRSAQKVELAPA
jgi:two-component system C4-dicarboxylate transport response regulator DctD